ncbi:MAG: Flp pilus assembly protein CpaB [Bryobacteraceae bacterium]|nr:Flp pilus assembly protein CpaB [Bryobacteraceae bacterium]
MTVLGVSLLFALVVSTVFYTITNRGSAPASKQAQASDTKDLVVTTKPLPVGTTIKPGDVKTIRVPVDQFPKGAYAKVEEVLDRPIISNILQDEPVMEGRLAARNSGAGLAPIIPVGMRAVTVRVTDVSAVAGFVMPGMRVDVLVTGRPPTASDTITTTALQNMMVLSAGTTIQPDARGQAMNAPNVTLLATPEQAEILTLAGNEGRIQLVLRNGNDQDQKATSGKTISQLYGYARLPNGGGPPRNPEAPEDRPKRVWRPAPVVVAAPTPRAPAPPPPPEQIVVIRGNTRTVETIKSGGAAADPNNTSPSSPPPSTVPNPGPGL